MLDTLRRPESDHVNFFVSYTGCDIGFAKWVAWELGRADFTYRIQAEHFTPGCRFIDEMKDWLQKSEQVIAILSPEYFQSSYASLEFNSAIAQDPLGKQRKVIPVRIKDFEMPALFRDLVFIDFVGKSEAEARRALIAGVRASRLSALGELQPVKERPTSPFETQKAVAATPQHQRTVIATSKTKPARVHFLACDTGRGLDFKTQRGLISNALRQSHYATQLKLKAELDVTDSNIFDKLNKYQPHVVHISGNQNAGDVLLPTSDGGEVIISDDALAGFLSSLGRQVRIAIIDTCYSYSCAKRVAEVVDCALGVSDFIYDDEAIRFYEIFYQAMAAGQSVGDAHGQAVSALRFKHVPSKRIPKLCMRPGVDASQFFLVGP
jgi:TIR domain